MLEVLDLHVGYCRVPVLRGVWLFVFFQAEDGIRDADVTGVQTCALPISFSFNKTTGERNAAKGFLEAPVIVNGEVQTGLGGGVCQVSTTVFNSAYEAGLKITSRTNHALYISHYPLGRDATVNYPDVDLKFVNDTGHWLLLRTFVGSSSLTVGLYGTPVNRKIETTTAPLRVIAAPPVQKTIDATLKPRTVAVDDY